MRGREGTQRERRCNCDGSEKRSNEENCGEAIGRHRRVNNKRGNGRTEGIKQGIKQGRHKDH